MSYEKIILDRICCEKALEVVTAWCKLCKICKMCRKKSFFLSINIFLLFLLCSSSHKSKCYEVQSLWSPFNLADLFSPRILLLEEFSATTVLLMRGVGSYYLAQMQCLSVHFGNWGTFRTHLEALYCQKFMKKLKIVFLPLATNSAEIVERVRGIMAAIPTSLIIESCVFLLVSCTISELAKKWKN